ncbi:MAG TPA: hypothetical protein VF594_04560 [Rubricoccaceae bacterium]
MPRPDAPTGNRTTVHVHTDVTIGYKRVSTGGGDAAARLGLAVLAIAYAVEHRAALARVGTRLASEVRRLAAPPGGAGE